MAKLTEAQRRALSVYADGKWRSAADAAGRIGINWPASGNFGAVVRSLYRAGLLAFRVRNGDGEYLITEAGRHALQAKGGGDGQ
jgi:hypothetical protein